MAVLGFKPGNLAAVSDFLTPILMSLSVCPLAQVSQPALGVSKQACLQLTEGSKVNYFFSFKQLPAQSSSVLSPCRLFCALRSRSHRLKSRWQPVCILLRKLWEESTFRLIQVVIVIGLRSWLTSLLVVEAILSATRSLPHSLSHSPFHCLRRLS